MLNISYILCTMYLLSLSLMVILVDKIIFIVCMKLNEAKSMAQRETTSKWQNWAIHPDLFISIKGSA